MGIHLSLRSSEDASSSVGKFVRVIFRGEAERRQRRIITSHLHASWKKTMSYLFSFALITTTATPFDNYSLKPPNQEAKSERCRKGPMMGFRVLGKRRAHILRRQTTADQDGVARVTKRRRRLQMVADHSGAEMYMPKSCICADIASQSGASFTLSKCC